jgi:hypothetical protein
MRGIHRSCLALLAGMLLAAAPSYAQSVIAGTVRDTSGAVMPGVTVEASSPALIEKSKTTTTDADGQYRIVDLRPGPYTVTFTLTGFSTFTRENLQLEANFTATINAEMRVGALEESVTVSGQSPTVDVQTTTRREVLSRELLDVLPTGRSFQGIGATLPSVSMGRFDVAGSNSMQQGVLVAYGGTGTDLAMEVDGMNVMGTLDKGWYPLVYHNDNEYQEMVYQVAGGPAESQTGGVRINMIPKEGGNQFRGNSIFFFSNGSLQSSNINDDLIARNYRSPGQLDKLWDVNPAWGGPLKQDRVWFFISYRNWAYNNTVGNQFYPDGRPALDDNLVQAYSNRLTMRLSSRDKLNFSWNRYPRIRYHSGIETGLNTPAGSGVLDIVQTHISQAKWTSTITDKLLLEAGAIIFPYYYNSRQQPDQRFATCYVAFNACPAGTDYGDIPHFNINTGITDVANGSGVWNRLWKDGVMTSLSYITGAHALKMGFTFQSGYNSNGTLNFGGSSLIQRYRGTTTAFVPGNWVPDSVTIQNAPREASSNADADVGIFVQDSWTMGRLTLNPGLRYEYLRGSTSEVDLPAGRFVPARHFDRVENLPNWKDISPRLGIAYDLFGTGRTAVKGSLGKYTQQESTGFSNTYNPSVASTDIRTWRDLNGDDIAQDIEIGPPTNATFGIRRNRNPDPDIKRPYQLLYNVGVQHEVRPGLAVSLNYFRRDYYRLIWTENLAIPVSSWADSYVPVVIPDPRGNGQSITVYNLRSQFVGLVNEIDRNSDNNSRVYNGIDLTFNSRFRNGATLIGGTSTGKRYINNCDVTDPNQLRGCEIHIPLQTQFKISGTYPLPYAFRFSGVFQSMPGIRETRTDTTDGDLVINYVINRTIIPTLSTAQVTTRLNEPGTDFLPRNNQLDLSLSREFRSGRYGIKPEFDLFNVFNVAPVTNEVTTWGPNLGQPLTILPGRLFRLGLKVDF